MLLHASLHELLPMIAALLGAGIVTGVLSGLLGVGGGGILVPVLYELFRIMGVDESIRMHLCVGTSLAIIIPTSFRAFQAQAKRGSVDKAVLREMGPGVLLGVIAGIFIAAASPGVVMKAVFSIAAGLMAAKLFFARPDWRLGKHLPAQPWPSLVSLFTGLISTLIGIGGGVFVSAFMTLYGRSIHQAIGTSSGFGPIIALPAAIGYMAAGWAEPGLAPLSLGYVNLLGAAIVAPAGVLAAPFGVRIAHKFSRRTLELAFASFLTLVAIRFLFSIFVG
jgi:uncharacterized membrane protein YfcA